MNVNEIIVVGGGSSGWMTAATLVKVFPEKKITVIEPKDIATVGVGESTLGGIKRWTRLMEINEKDFFKFTDASYKMSIKFTDFYKKDSGSFHYPFGFPFFDENTNPFFDWSLKKYFYPNTETQDFIRNFFPSSYLFENNKFSKNEHLEFDNFSVESDVAYHFDATKFGLWLKENYCIKNGVNIINESVVDVKLNDDGIKSIILSSGKEISGDLYIDCTGFSSLLLGKHLNEKFISYSDMLPNNKAWATKIEYKNKEKELEGYTNCTAIENGWCWNIPLWSRIGTGYVYSDKYISDEKALEEFKTYLSSDKMVVKRSRQEIENLEFKNINMRVGIHERTFVKNVVAIGLSAGFIEPLESNGLFSVHEFLFKLIDILQRGEISQFDRDMYNVSVRDTFDGFSKFVSLHYALSHRTDTDYWKEIYNKNFTDHTLDPYSQTVKRADNFYNLIWRYMEEWGHPVGNGGITYIANGMNLNMMNCSRVQDLEFRYNVNLKNQVDQLMLEWDKRKLKWMKNSEDSETLSSFLKKEFYS